MAKTSLATIQNEAERQRAEESKAEAEAKCKTLQDTTDRLERDLARLTAQVRVRYLLYTILNIFHKKMN